MENDYGREGKKMKVSLLSSPFVVPEPYLFHSVAPPLGLLYIASTLRDKGHDVSIIDLIAANPFKKRSLSDGINRFGLTNEDVIKELDGQSPDVIGVSIMFINSFGASVSLLNSIADNFPDAVLVAGGHAATVAYADLFQSVEGLDAVALGEGEWSFPEWLGQSVMKGRLKGHPSIATRNTWNSGKDHTSAIVEDIDSLPMPSHDLALNKYGNYTSYPICTSRGCPRNCIFCSVHTLCGRRWRTRNLKDISKEIDYLSREFEIDSFYITDDNFSLDPFRVIDFCKDLNKLGVHIRWNCLSGITPETISYDMLQSMKESGCEALSLAVESANEYIQKKIGKKVSLKKVRKIIAWCREMGIFTNGMFIIGIPGETKETVEESLDFALDARFDGISVAIATPFPGTRLYDECTTKGYLVERDVGNYNLRESLISTPQLTAKELKALQTYFLRKYEEDYRGPLPYEKVKLYMRNPNRESWEALQSYLS
ncbi:MAG: radical SAM protein [Thermodesulfobacteriota bacterium]|nr:radical SAM protein [Thermodesulfobacteriota bacterium]